VNENAVFQAVLGLVAAGEYLDKIPGVPMPSMDGGGVFQRTPDGRYRRIYQRGSTEYLQARSSGLVEPLPAVLVPATEAAVEEAEHVLGLPLPPLLRRLYLEVGNGGFGPGQGILGLAGDHRGRTALDLYRHAHGSSPLAFYPDWSSLPAALLPLCSWGCGIYSFVDCSDARGPMWAWDPNPAPADVHPLFPEPVAFAEWLARWLGGTLIQPVFIQDPGTGQWRGATDEDWERL
jgi:hypothetical protein